jgi:hypothetical protein
MEIGHFYGLVVPSERDDGRAAALPYPISQDVNIVLILRTNSVNKQDYRIFIINGVT